MTSTHNNNVVLVSADTEWKVLRELYAGVGVTATPFGEFFSIPLVGIGHAVTFFKGGWGKISAAASTQYVVDHLKPDLLVNIGTCGGIDESLKRGDIVLANETIVYDIVEQMGDPDEAICAYSAKLDVSWASGIKGVDAIGLLLSADRDVVQADLQALKAKYPHALAADWESGAIAWTAARNQMPLLILRGVSDVVTSAEALAYADISHFEQGTRDVLVKILACLPELLEH